MRQLPIERRRGGWFVIDEINGSSGPWETEDAAMAARLGDYERAHQLDRAAKQRVPPAPETRPDSGTPSSKSEKGKTK